MPHPIDQLFRSKLAQDAQPVAPDTWDRIAQDLGPKPPQYLKIVRWATATALLGLVVGLWVYQMRSDAVSESLVSSPSVVRRDIPPSTVLTDPVESHGQKSAQLALAAQVSSMPPPEQDQPTSSITRIQASVADTALDEAPDSSPEPLTSAIGAWQGVSRSIDFVSTFPTPPLRSDASIDLLACTNAGKQPLAFLTNWGVNLGLLVQGNTRVGWQAEVFRHWPIASRWSLNTAIGGMQVDAPDFLRFDGSGPFDEPFDPPLLSTPRPDSIVYTLNFRNLAFAHVSASLNYQLHPRLSLYLGGNLEAMVRTQARRTFRLYQADSPDEIGGGAGGITQRFDGLRRWNTAIVLGANVHIWRGLSLDGHYHWGAIDLTREETYGDRRDFLRFARLGLRYQF